MGTKHIIKRASGLSALSNSEPYCNLIGRITFRFWEPDLRKNDPALTIDPTVRWLMGRMIGKVALHLAHAGKPLNRRQVGGEMWRMLGMDGIPEKWMRETAGVQV